MSGLPFITAPKKSFESVEIGTEEIGILSIKKLGGLSINERKYLRTLTKDLPDLRREAVRMAKKIVASSGDRLIDVYNALTVSDTNFLSEYLEEVLEFQRLMEEVSEARQSALATTLLKFRIDPSWTEEKTGDPELIRLDLVALIAEFAQNEENGWRQPEPEPTEEQAEEALGNS